MKKGLGKVALILGFIALLCLALYFLTNNENGEENTVIHQKLEQTSEYGGIVSETHKLVGTKIPNFSYKDMNGNTISSEDMFGKSSIIALISVGCQSCKEYFPILNDYKNSNKQNQNVYFFYPYDTKDQVNNYLNELLIVDRTNFVAGEESLGSRFNLEFTPTSVFINDEGIITSVHVGALTKEVLEQIIKDKL